MHARGGSSAELNLVPQNVESFELPTIEVVAIDTYVISGQLIDDNDHPIPDTRVVAVDRNRRNFSGMSDAKGLFRVKVPVGTEAEIEFHIDETSMLRGESVPVKVVQQDPLIVRSSVDVRQKEKFAARPLKPDIDLTGRVLSSDGPVAGVFITLKRVVAFKVAASGQTLHSNFVASETRTGTNGKYRLTGLKAGDTYEIEMTPPFPAGVPILLKQSRIQKMIPDDAKDPIELPDLNILKLTRSIEGTVVDTDGNPVKDAVLFFYLQGGIFFKTMAPGGLAPMTKTDSKGRFRQRKLPESPLQISVNITDPTSGQIRSSAKFEVDTQQQDVRIVLDPYQRDELGNKLDGMEAD